MNTGISFKATVALKSFYYKIERKVVEFIDDYIFDIPEWLLFLYKMNRKTKIVTLNGIDITKRLQFYINNVSSHPDMVKKKLNRIEKNSSSFIVTHFNYVKKEQKGIFHKIKNFDLDKKIVKVTKFPDKILNILNRSMDINDKDDNVVHEKPIKYSIIKL
jgi:hypothetical protein